MRTDRTLAILVMSLGQLFSMDAFAFYNPNTGRWLSRDVQQEDAGPNLFGFVCNDSINLLDPLGERILDLTVTGFGGSELEATYPGTWRAAFEEVYRSVGEGPSLGFRGGIGTETGIFWDTHYAVGLLKFEAKASWEIPEKGDLAVWHFYKSNVRAYRIDNTGHRHAIYDQTEEIPDGPHGQLVTLIDPKTGKTLGPHCTINTWGYDAPRLAVLVPKSANYASRYYLSGDWRIRVEDSENAMEKKVHLEFSFSDASPAGGSGSFSTGPRN